MASRDLDPSPGQFCRIAPSLGASRTMLTGAVPLSRRLEAAHGKFCLVPRGICLVCVFLKQPQRGGRGVMAKGVLGAGVSGWPLGTVCWRKEKGMGLGNRVESSEALEGGRVPDALRTSCSWKGRSHPSSVARGGALSRALGGCSLSLARSSSGPWALRGGGQRCTATWSPSVHREPLPPDPEPLGSCPGPWTSSQLSRSVRNLQVLFPEVPRPGPCWGAWGL